MHDIGPAISRLREEKDSSEIEKLRTAGRITDRLLTECIEQIEPGDSEADIEREFRKRVLDSETDEFGGGIVTVGERTALPHTTTGTRKVTSGDLVMIDVGVVLEGYHSDITRTVAVGDVDAELETIYETVRRAARAAREAVAPGVPYQEIDRAARTIIEDAGYGEYFVHRAGHGLGLEGHEPPYLVEGNESTLSVGNVITVEPGIYIEDLGGVRIEDDVVLTDEGAETLTQTTRELVRL
ncbi:M24 family metallopeptidase [Haladaptatus sp. AB643]|nr:M24 family metallopeptidase [Haladaptatus sp. AB643]